MRAEHETVRPGPAFDRRLMAPLILGAVLNPINTTILAVALVPIGRALDVPASQTAWLVSALYLTTAIGQPVVGRLIDLFGPRRLFLLGAALVGVGGVLGTVAPNLAVLIGARVLIGLGTCAGYPAAMYLIRSEARRTGRDSPRTILTVLAVASQTVAVIGPALGGLLIGIGGWRATFAINVPLAVAGIVLGWIALPRDAPDNGDEPGSPPGLDLTGMLLFGGTLTMLLLFGMEPSVPDLWMLGAFAVLGAAFVVRELRARDPFLDVRLVGGNLPLLATYVRQMLGGLAVYTVLYGVSQWLQEGRGVSPTEAGLLLLAPTASGLLVAAATGRRPEIKAKIVVGAAFQLAGAAMLLLVDDTTPFWALVLILVAFGIPQGLLPLGNQNAVYHQADGSRLAASAGLLRTAMYLGAIAAAGAISALVGPRADTAGLHDLATFLIGSGAVLLVLAAADRSLRATASIRRVPA
ncbi:UNVERIFIED_CONTAM: MFS transporter [Mumia flava]